MRVERGAALALAFALALAAPLARAQLFGERGTAWRDEQPPAPPPLRTDGLVPIDVGPGSSLRFGVDPQSVSISPQGVVRYVVVARSASGAVNAMYEGLLCNGAQVKVYARHDPQRGWVDSPGDWQPLEPGRAAVRHSLAIARQGACDGAAPNGPVERLLRDLADPGDHRRRDGN